MTDEETVREALIRLWGLAEGPEIQAFDRILAKSGIRGQELAMYEAIVQTKENEIERLRAVVSRYADHDRACDARENALYACTCGFVEMVGETFPGQAFEGKDA